VAQLKNLRWPRPLSPLRHQFVRIEGSISDENSISGHLMSSPKISLFFYALSLTQTGELDKSRSSSIDAAFVQGKPCQGIFVTGLVEWPKIWVA
jgi:hypothetical protein